MNNNRTDIVVASTSSILAVLAIFMPIIGIGQPIQFVSTLGGIILGPGSLACRLATGSKWSECLMVGLALNISLLMLLALTAVVAHLWYPKIELIIPAATCTLAIVLYRRRATRLLSATRIAVAQAANIGALTKDEVRWVL